jgi:hypothetical protein
MDQATATYMQLLLEPAHTRLELAEGPVLGSDSSTQRGDLGACCRHVGFKNRNPILTRLFFGFFVGQTAFGLAELQKCYKSKFNEDGCDDGCTNATEYPF